MNESMKTLKKIYFSNLLIDAIPIAINESNIANIGLPNLIVTFMPVKPSER